MAATQDALAWQAPAPAGTDDERHAPWLTLEIVKGRTAYSQRPVIGPRFLIGAGDTCGLQLGGSEMPELHTLIQFRGRHVWIEPLAAHPELLLNGEPTHGEWLRDGDVLAIGPFKLRAHIITVRPEVVAAAAPRLAGDAHEQPIDPAALTTSELVEQIGAEQRLVQDFDEGRRAGIEALRQAIRVRRPSLPDVVPAPERASEIEAGVLAELERLCRDLDQLMLELQQRNERLADREETYDGAAADLIEVQQQLLSQIDTLTAQVAASRSQERSHPGPTRASA